MGIAEVIKGHKRIMCDTAPIIYFIEEHKVYGKVVDGIFKLLKGNTDFLFFSSVVTLTEVLTQPLRKFRMDIVDKYRKFLLNSSSFIVYSIDTIIAEKAAGLRAQYGIRTPDALQIAVGIENNGSLFITNDKNLKNIKEIEVLVIGDYL